MERPLFDKYHVQKKIGVGAFSEIYLAKIMEYRGKEFAVKMEPKNAKRKQLLLESKIYRKLQGETGIPNLYHFGEDDQHNILVLDLLGPNLEELFNYCGRKFSLKTVLLIADQLITRIEYLHSKNFVHRDIKPENFLVGLGKDSETIHVIDFGLTKKYQDPRTGLHTPYKENKSLAGTVRYLSINSHLGIRQTRRDDLESIGYILVYFLRSELPWMGIKAENRKEKYSRIMHAKVSISPDVLCRGYPDEFAKYLTYTRSLRFEEKPDYLYIKRLFRDLYVRMFGEWDLVFDWVILNAMNSIDQTGNNPNNLDMNKKGLAALKQERQEEKENGKHNKSKKDKHSGEKDKSPKKKKDEEHSADEKERKKSKEKKDKKKEKKEDSEEEKEKDAKKNGKKIKDKDSEDEEEKPKKDKKKKEKKEEESGDGKEHKKSKEKKKDSDSSSSSESSDSDEKSMDKKKKKKDKKKDKDEDGSEDEKKDQKKKDKKKDKGSDDEESGEKSKDKKDKKKDKEGSDSEDGGEKSKDKKDKEKKKKKSEEPSEEEGEDGDYDDEKYEHYGDADGEEEGVEEEAYGEDYENMDGDGEDQQ